MAMTYETLYNTIQAYAENTEQLFVANIPVFVEQAEKRIYNTVQIPALRRNVTGTATAGNKYLSLPDDYLSTYSLAAIDTNGDYYYLLNKDVNFIREAYPTASDTGQPVHYAIFGPNSTMPNELTFILGPTPDDQYYVELHYYYYPESITTASSGTTWLGDNYPMCLLYGALVEANIFLKGEADLQQNYEKLFTDNMGLLKNYADGRTRNDNFRTPLPRGKYQ